MSQRCRSCRRQLRLPSPDGLGPKCRRAQQPPKPKPAPAATNAKSPARPDHNQLTAAGQLTIPTDQDTEAVTS